MGNLFGTKRNVEEADLNLDGVITKEEFNKWSQDMKNEMDTFRKEYENKNIEANELNKQIETLKKINEDLEYKLLVKNMNESGDNVNGKVRLKAISKKRIEDYTEFLIQDKETNIGWMPDFVERKLYRNVFEILINLLTGIAESTSLKILGHEITLDLEPEEDDKEE